MIIFFLFFTIIIAEIKKGSCGQTDFEDDPDCRYEYDTETQILKLLGNGTMRDGFMDIPSAYKAFKNEIKHVIMEDTLTTVGGGAFYDLKVVKTIKLSENATSIGHYAFSFCVELETIEIGSKVTEIGDMIFWENPSMISYYIHPDNAYMWTDEYGCFYMKHKKIIRMMKYPSNHPRQYFQIPEYVTEIYDSAFYNAINLKEITLSNSVTSIRMFSFFLCTSLTSIIIPASVRDIQVEAFEQCSSLQHFLFEGKQNLQTEPYYDDSLISCSSSMFPYVDFDQITMYVYKNIYINETLCTKTPIFINSIDEFPSNYSKIMKWHETNCGERCNWKYDNVNKTLRIYGKGIISDTFGWNTIRKEVKTVIIERGISGIHADTFNGFDNLETVELIYTIDFIEANAFRNCESLTSFDVKMVDDFQNCTEGFIDKTMPINVTVRECYKGETFCGLPIQRIPDDFIVIEDSSSSINDNETISTSSSSTSSSNNVPNISEFSHSDENTSNNENGTSDQYTSSNSNEQNLPTDSNDQSDNNDNNDKPRNGKCGLNCQWEYNEKQLTLVFKSSNINEMGRITNRTEFEIYKSEVKIIRIENGIEIIGENVFEHFIQMTTLFIGKDVKRLEKNALNNCTSLKEIKYYGRNDICKESGVQLNSNIVVNVTKLYEDDVFCSISLSNKNDNDGTSGGGGDDTIILISILVPVIIIIILLVIIVTIVLVKKHKSKYSTQGKNIPGIDVELNQYEYNRYMPSEIY